MPTLTELPQDLTANGEELYSFAKELFPICRSLTGPGVRQTLQIIKKRLEGSGAELKVHEVPSGTQCFDWKVPDEWTIRGARLTGPSGEKIVDFADHNLHVVGYSIPVDAEMTLAELEPHLFSMPDSPEAIPYVTSYYKRSWGFCLPHRQRQSLKKGKYRARIDSDLKPGVMNYGEIRIPGETDKEILLSTNICHPSMGNNELSGPVVAAFLAASLARLRSRRYGYQVLFLPETIGSIAYLSRHLDALKKNVVAGFQVICCGDDKAYYFVPSRLGDTLADKAALHVLKHTVPDCKMTSFLTRGSDERQYCSPGVDLPVVSMMRSKYAEYPEYHSSLDDLSFISPKGLQGGFDLHARCLRLLENNRTYKVNVLCEPQLGKRGLYPTTSQWGDAYVEVFKLINVMAYCDGRHDLIDIAERLGVYAEELLPIVVKLKDGGVLEEVVS